MKQTIVKGRPLTEKDLKEVKGGEFYFIKVITSLKPFSCDSCGYTISKFITTSDEDIYTAICEYCGCCENVKMEA